MPNDDPAVEVHRVQVKIPPFWPEDPELWFAQVESQFQISRITNDDTKYGYVAGNLEARYAREVRDVLTDPPVHEKYLKIKTELIKRLSISQEQRTKQLLEREELGDRKPSQFLRHLQPLAGSAVPDTLLRSIWSSRLPPNVQAILATQAKASLVEVAELADVIMSTAPAQIQEARTFSDDSTIKALMEEVAQLKTQLRSRSSSRARYHGRDRSKSKRRDSDTCWYHSRFGNQARKCTPPCKAASNQGNEPSSR